MHGGAVPSHEGPEPVEPATHLPPSPPSIVGLAKQRPQDVAHIRRHAEDLLGSSPLPPRFTDAELMRHAVHQGFLRTHDDASRARALSHAATSVAHTVEWLRRHEFASEDELQQYAHLLWWSDAAGNPSPGNDPVIPGQPLKLHVAIGRAVQECRGPAAVHFANAVITQVERAVTHRLRDEDGADRVDVVVYAAGTSALSASRAGWVLKAVVSTLSHHYPGRLNELVLLDLPKVLTLMVLGAKKLVHAETSRKVRSTTSQEWVEVLKRRATEASTGVRMER